MTGMGLLFTWTCLVIKTVSNCVSTGRFLLFLDFSEGNIVDSAPMDVANTQCPSVCWESRLNN